MSGRSVSLSLSVLRFFTSLRSLRLASSPGLAYPIPVCVRKRALGTSRPAVTTAAKARTHSSSLRTHKIAFARTRTREALNHLLGRVEPWHGCPYWRDREGRRLPSARRKKPQRAPALGETIARVFYTPLSVCLRRFRVRNACARRDPRAFALLESAPHMCVCTNTVWRRVETPIRRADTRKSLVFDYFGGERVYNMGKRARFSEDIYGWR